MMTLEEVQAAKADGKKVMFKGHPVDVWIATEDRIMVSSPVRSSGEDATLEQLSPL